MRRFALIAFFVVLALAGCGGSGSGTAPQIKLQGWTPGTPSPIASRIPVFDIRLKTFLAPVVGEVFTTDNGRWSFTPTSFSYAWQDCDSNGANCVTAAGSPTNTSRYAITSGDATFRVRSVVTASDATHAASQPSAPTGIVNPPPPTNISPPIITGTPTQGQTLTTTNGTWTSNGSSATCGGGVITCVIQWQRCSPSCSNIVGANGSTYLLALADVGDTIQVTVTATNGGGSTPASSAQTATIAGSGGGAAPVNTVAPYFCGSTSPAVASNTDAIGGCAVLTGSAVQGQTLSVGTGVWSNAPTSFSYQWQRCSTSIGQPPTTTACSNISAATSSTYTVQAADVGHSLVPIVTAFNGSTASTPTTIAGSCASGSTPGGSAVGHTTSFTDPTEGVGCSPISAVVGTTNNTTSTGEKFCTNAPITCGFPDPIAGNVGVPPGTTLTPGTINCSSGTVSGVYSTSTTVSGTCTLTNDRIVNGGFDYNQCGTTLGGAGCTFSHLDGGGNYTNESNATLGIGRMQNVSSHCNYSFSDNSASTGGNDGTFNGTPDFARGQTSVTANSNYFHCGSEDWNGNVGISNSYIISDECYGPNACYGVATTHNEAIFNWGDTTGTTANPKLNLNDVLAVPWGQTADFFDNCDASPAHWHINGNLFIGVPNNSALNNCGGNTGTDYQQLNNRVSFMYEPLNGPDPSCQALFSFTGQGNVDDQNLSDLGTYPGTVPNC